MDEQVGAACADGIDEGGDVLDGADLGLRKGQADERDLVVDGPGEHSGVDTPIPVHSDDARTTASAVRAPGEGQAGGMLGRAREDQPTRIAHSRKGAPQGEAPGLRRATAEDDVVGSCADEGRDGGARVRQCRVGDLGPVVEALGAGPEALGCVAVDGQQARIGRPCRGVIEVGAPGRHPCARVMPAAR